MKALIVFYSRTGYTRKIAMQVSKALSKDFETDVDEIIDEKNRKGALGYLRAGRDASLKVLTKIKTHKNPADYDLVIIGTPVWAFTMATAVRTFLVENKRKLEKVAFFSTYGSGAANTFRDMTVICEKKPVALLGASTVEVAKKSYEKKVNEFVWKIKGKAVS
ncbi:MAG: hypothetical protein V1659_01145 [Candidatus Woesearchaeota archaeon]